MKLILENWNKFLSENQLNEASALVEVRSSAEDSDVIETLDNYLQNKKKLYSGVKTFLNSNLTFRAKKNLLNK